MLSCTRTVRSRALLYAVLSRPGNLWPHDLPLRCDHLLDWRVLPSNESLCHNVDERFSLLSQFLAARNDVRTHGNFGARQVALDFISWQTRRTRPYLTGEQKQSGSWRVPHSCQQPTHRAPTMTALLLWD